MSALSGLGLGLVSVGTKNPAKILATRKAFARFWPQLTWSVTDCVVDAPVQPMSDDAAREGSIQRAHSALEMYAADFGVGMEGGLSLHAGRWFDTGWITVVSQYGLIGQATTLRVVVPEPCMDLVNAGHELGTACDLIFGQHNSKQGLGHFGLMTGGLLNRTDEFCNAIIAALGDLAFGTNLSELMAGRRAS